MPIDPGVCARPAASAGGNGSTFNRAVLPLAIALLIFTVLSTWLAIAKAPWCDEGAFANPSYNLAFHGKMNANVLNPAGHFLNAYLKGIQERTYIVVPNHLVALAGWYRIFGFSLLTMRAYSIVWGALAIPVFFFICRRLMPELGVAQLGALLTSIDFVYLWISADGRMETAANTLALASIAAYLYLRESSLPRAVFVSQLLSAAAVFTHPNAVLTQLALAVLVWRFDRERLRWRHLLPAGVPYLFFGALWATYIAQSPGDFAAQFFANAAGRDSSRWKTIVQPWEAAWNELVRETGVYVASGLWSGAMNTWLMFIPMFYAGALIAFFRKYKSFPPSAKTFLVAAVALVLGMTFLNGFKAPMYMVYLLPFYNAILAWGFIRLWKSGNDGKLMAVAGGCGFAALQMIASVQHIQADEYHRDYLPAIVYLKQEQASGKSIVGSAALGFGLGFAGFEDDWRLGLYSHLKPDVLVLDRSYRDFIKRFEKSEPSVFVHSTKILTADYRFVKRFGTYWIFERAIDPASGPIVDVRDMAMKEKGKQADYLFEQIERHEAATAATGTDTSSKDIHAAIRP